jgi:hypothetical protein
MPTAPIDDLPAANALYDFLRKRAFPTTEELKRQ